MIKRSLVFFILALLCSAAVTGTGFAMWSYTEKAERSQALGVKITQSSIIGSFSLPEIKYVVLDGGTGSGVNPTITGVSFYKYENGSAVTDNSFVITFTVDEKYRDFINADKNYEKVGFGISVDVPIELKPLIVHTPFYTSRLEGSFIDLKALTIELTDHFSDGTNSDFRYDSSTGQFTFNLTTVVFNRFFTYSSSYKPEDLDKYNNLLLGNVAPLFEIKLYQTYAETTG